MGPSPSETARQSGPHSQLSLKIVHNFKGGRNTCRKGCLVGAQRGLGGKYTSHSSTHQQSGLTHPLCGGRGFRSGRRSPRVLMGCPPLTPPSARPTEAPASSHQSRDPEPRPPREEDRKASFHSPFGEKMAPFPRFLLEQKVLYLRQMVGL